MAWHSDGIQWNPGNEYLHHHHLHHLSPLFRFKAECENRGKSFLLLSRVTRICACLQDKNSSIIIRRRNLWWDFSTEQQSIFGPLSDIGRLPARGCCWLPVFLPVYESIRDIRSSTLLVRLSKYVCLERSGLLGK